MEILIGWYEEKYGSSPSEEFTDKVWRENLTAGDVDVETLFGAQFEVPKFKEAFANRLAKRLPEQILCELTTNCRWSKYDALIICHPLRKIQEALTAITDERPDNLQRNENLRAYVMRKVEESGCRTLGKGGQGEVFRVQNPLWNKTDHAWSGHKCFAVKVQKPGSVSRRETEQDIHERLSRNSEYVVKLLDAWERKGASGAGFHLLEYCHTDLKKVSEWKRSQGLQLSATEVASLMFDLARGIRNMHEQRVAHLDVKPGNSLIVYTTDGNDYGVKMTAKLADFGLSREIPADDDDSPRTDIFVGTPLFLPPEIVRARGVSFETEPRTYRLKPADMWMWGITLYVLVHGRAPWAALTVESVCHKIKRNERVVWDATKKKDGSLWKQLHEMYRATTHPEPTQRPSAEDVCALLAEALASSPRTR